MLTSFFAFPSASPTGSYTLSTTSPSPSPSSAASNGTSSSGTDTSDLNGVGKSLPFQSVLYMIAFVGLMMAIFYTIFVARRDRRRRRANRENDIRNADPEMGEHRNNTTFRPDSAEDGSPPQYMSHTLDQPYLGPEITPGYPDHVHHGTQQQQGLIQHLTGLGQHQRDQDSDSTRPILTTTTTTTSTTTTTTTITLPSSSPRSYRSEAESLEGTGASVPVTEISAPAPAFFTGRHMSILRLGLSNYHHHHNDSDNARNRNSRVSSPSSSNTSSPALSRSTSPHRNVAEGASNRVSIVSNLMTTSFGSVDATSTPTAAQGSNIAESGNTSNAEDHINIGRNVRFHESAVTARGEGSGAGLVVIPPALHRLRSSGPPPYIPLSSEEAPPLPPSYNAVAATSE